MKTTTENAVDENAIYWRFPRTLLAIVVVAGALLLWVYWGGIDQLIYRWGSSEEYGYGYMIPAIVAFFVWQKQNHIERIEFTGSLSGVILLAVAGLLLLLGELATLYIVVQYAFVLAVFGLVLAVTGWRVFLMLLPALALLFFMIPLPNFLYQGLSSQLQLISSEIGVMIIRTFGISVFLEGNVIDLGPYQLQVVEACSGLRYLFPLTALAYMAAYMFHGAMWKKVVIFISSAPITVLMNSFRIGVIGVLVEHFGIEQAEGFLHDFEGWIVFMACMVILIAEMWLLNRIGGGKSFADAFRIDLPEHTEGERADRALPRLMVPVAVVLVIMAMLPIYLDKRSEIVPERKDFASFPLQHAGWRGARDTIEQQYIDVLQFDDYLMADFERVGGSSRETVNLYSAYYESQRKGASIHSPRSCIPGGGWEIREHNVVDVTLDNGTRLNVNRLLIQKGEHKQLVYYWFDQRGRTMTNEYLVKWYLFWDAIKLNRTDGALMRVTTLLEPGENIESNDELLRDFLSDFHDVLTQFVPE